MTRTVAALTFCLTLLSSAGSYAAERARAGATTPPNQWRTQDVCGVAGDCRAAPFLVPALTCAACEAPVELQAALERAVSSTQRALCEIARHVPLVAQWATCGAASRPGAMAHR
jgi:hypothetical protein